MKYIELLVIAASNFVFKNKADVISYSGLNFKCFERQEGKGFQVSWIRIVLFMLKY